MILTLPPPGPNPRFKPPLRLVSGLRAWDPSIIAVVAVVMLGVGVYRREILSPVKKVRALGGAVRASLPPGWNADETKDQVILRKPALSTIAPTVVIRKLSELMTPSLLDAELARIEASRASSGIGYRVLEAQERSSFGGHPTHWTRYALIVEPRAAGSSQIMLPVLIEGVDVLVTPSHGSAYHVAAWTTASNFQDPDCELKNVIESLQLAP